MMTTKELLDMLAEYVKEDYNDKIGLAKFHNEDCKELEEERDELLNDINRQV